MSEPAVSVIVPAYNAADVVGQALQSVREQTFTDYEVVVVDDGSSDATWEVLEKWAGQWDRLRVFRAEHAGLAAARNRAVREMRGQWIALLDADDLWLPDKLARCMAFLADHPDLSIVYTPMDPVTADGHPMAGHSKPCHAGQLTRRLFESIFVHDPAVVFHRRVIDAVGGFDESLPVCVGHEFWLRVSTQFEFGLIDEPLALRRWTDASLTRRNRSRGMAIKARMLERFYFEKGGARLLDRREAIGRIARVYYSAGKILTREGSPRRGMEHIGRAIGYRKSLLKAYPFWLWAGLRSLMGRDANAPAG
ncbi:MAG: hypothetical protein BIFFINMI_00726 [Phycisphaerae bacterium]|nr:hypothetical protein [Phycisphaerae bacterium]